MLSSLTESQLRSLARRVEAVMNLERRMIVNHMHTESFQYRLNTWARQFLLNQILKYVEAHPDALLDLAKWYSIKSVSERNVLNLQQLGFFIFQYTSWHVPPKSWLGPSWDKTVVPVSAKTGTLCKLLDAAFTWTTTKKETNIPVSEWKEFAELGQRMVIQFIDSDKVTFEDAEEEWGAICEAKQRAHQEIRARNERYGDIIETHRTIGGFG